MFADTKTCIVAAGFYCSFGMVVPLAPTAVALSAVLLVRILVWTRSRSLAWNIVVGCLAMLAAFVTVEGLEEATVFTGFWIGVGYGAAGVSIIEFARAPMFNLFRARLASAAAVLIGTGAAAPTEDEEAK